MLDAMILSFVTSLVTVTVLMIARALRKKPSRPKARSAMNRGLAAASDAVYAGSKDGRIEAFSTRELVPCSPPKCVCRGCDGEAMRGARSLCFDCEVASDGPEPHGHCTQCGHWRKGLEEVTGSCRECGWHDAD